MAIVDKAAGQVGMGELVDLFVAEGLTREQVDQVLDAGFGRANRRFATALPRRWPMP